MAALLLSIQFIAMHVLQEMTVSLLNDPLSILLVSFCLLALYAFVRSIHGAYVGPLSKIPGPRIRAFTGLPRLQSTWTGRGVRDLVQLHKQYGPVVRIAPDYVSFVGSDVIWKQLYGSRTGAKTKSFNKDPKFYVPPLNGVADVIVADDPNHARQRKILGHAFSDRALKQQEPLLHKYMNSMVQRLREGANNSQSIDMVVIFNACTFDIMSDLSFAEGLGMLEQSDYVPWVKTIFSSIKAATRLQSIRGYSSVLGTMVMALSTALPSVKKAAWEHWAYTMERVDRRLAAPTTKRPDLWSTILEQNAKSEEPLSLQEQYSTAATFMLAGTETTATALSGTLYYLLQNPRYLDQLTTDLRTVFATMNDLSVEKLGKMPLLTAVITEGLRMYPPVPTALLRCVPLGGCEVAGYYIPAGTSVGIHQFASYRDPSNFTDADQFRPDRWMGAEKYAQDNRGAFEPFSAGPRNCVGRNLGWMEMRLLLAATLFCFDIQLDSVSKKWSEQDVFVLWEKNELRCLLKHVVS